MTRISPYWPANLDRYDLAILKILQRDNSTPQRSIGEAVILSAPAVQRHIKRLEESGVIQSNMAIVDPAQIGQPITIIAEVEVESEPLDLLKAAKISFASASEVQQCYFVTGEADFILIIVVATMSNYEALTHRLFFKNHDVKRFPKFVAMGPGQNRPSCALSHTGVGNVMIYCLYQRMISCATP